MIQNSFEHSINGLINLIETYDSIEFALYGHSIWEGRTANNIYKIMEGLLAPYLEKYYPILLTDDENFSILCDYILNCCNFNLEKFNHLCEILINGEDE